MKKMIFLFIFIILSLSMSWAQKDCSQIQPHWIKIEKYIPYPPSDNPNYPISFSVTVPLASSSIKYINIGGDAELFWSVSGNIVTCKTTVGQFKNFVKSFPYSCQPWNGMDVHTPTGIKTYYIQYQIDPWWRQ